MSTKWGHGVCRIEVAKVEWSYLQPWQRTTQHKSLGTGFVIDGERLLTNAHVVASAVDIRIRPYGSTRRFPAEVICYAPDVDLALLKIKGESQQQDFFGHCEGTMSRKQNAGDDDDDDNDNEESPDAREEDEEGTVDNPPRKRLRRSMALKFATELPNLQEAVHVVGFPTGGRTICVTEGVVSRIDLSDRIVLIQIDAAINAGGSGGPAFDSKGQVTGVAFKKKADKKSDNIGYLISSVQVLSFLGRVDSHTGKYTLSAAIPYRYHGLENHSLRQFHKVPDDVHGVLITSVCDEDETHEADAEGDSRTISLRKGDILTKIDDRGVADDGQIVLRGDELIQHSYVIHVKKTNESVAFSVYRNGKHITCSPVVLRDIPSLIPRWVDVDFVPNYMILGSAVMLPFSLAIKQYNGCGSLLKADSITYYKMWPREWENLDGLVVMTQLFANELSFSYSRPWRRVTTYNGVRITSLKHLQELWAENCAAVEAQDEKVLEGDATQSSHDTLFARLELENDDDVKAAMKTQSDVLKTYQIPSSHQILPPNPNYHGLAWRSENDDIMM